MEKVIIVNENDKPIGSKERGSILEGDIYRVSALWIKNSNGDILLAQRSFSKKNDPGLWGPAVAGTNDERETYLSNIIKETEEEIGLKNINLKKSFYHFKDGKHKHFTQWFEATVDTNINEFKIQKDEVENLKWFNKEELKEAFVFDDKQFINGMKDIFETFEGKQSF